MKDDILSLGVDVDIANAMRQMDRFEKDMKKRMRNVTRAVDALNKTNIKGIHEATDNFHDWLDEMDDVALAHDNQVKKLEKVIDTIEELRRVQEDASDEQKRAIQDNIDLLEEQAKVLGGDVSKKVFARANFNMTAKNITDSMEKGLDAAAPAFRSFFSKDLKGFIEDGVKLSGKALGFGLSKAASGLVKRGSALKESGERMAQRGKSGGAGGAAMSLMGGSLKVIGGLATKLGPVIGTLSKLAPVFSVLSSSILAVVKLFIDAEAQTKQFQKEILASASTSEFLAGNVGDAAMSMVKLEDTLKGVREAAYSLDNVSWGINADDHKAVINVLTQEGVSLHRIAQEAEAGQKSIQDFAADLTHVSVAYSRAFGVPLQEVNQLQAEMMVDMGKSLDETRLAFAQMTRSAAESGIAANRFFAIIRGVSQDLSLYNIRMESAIKLLGKLGKVMNPRNAQKFMQTASQGLKNMSQDDRLKVALLTGGKGAAIVRKDIQNRERNLARDIADATGKQWEHVAADLRDPKRAAELWKEVEAKQPGKLGALRESALELGIDKRASQKGVYGQAFAMENLGMGASLEMMQTAIAGWGGGKTLTEGAGSLGMTKMAEMLGYSTEQMRGMMKLEVAVQEQKDALLAQASTEEEKARINAMGIQDVLDTMSEEERNTLEDQTKSVTDYARKQANLTQSLLDKLSTLVDFVMNQVYNVMVDIWDSVSRIPGVGSSDDERAIRRKALTSKDKLFQDAVKAATDESGNIDMNSLRGKLVMGPGGLGDTLSKSFDHYFEAQKKGDANERALTSEGITNLIKALPELTTSQAYKSAEAAGLAPEKLMALSTQLSGGKGLQEAMATAGLSQEDQAKVYQKSLWFADPTKLSRMAPELAGFDQTIGKLRARGSSMDMDSGITSGFHESEEGIKLLSNQSQSAKDTASATQDLADAGAYQKESLAVKFGPTFLGGKYKNTIEEAVLAAMRTALFEFYLYSEIEDRGQVLEYMNRGSGMTPASFSKNVGDAAQLGISTKSMLEMPANAYGGVVTGVSEGLATVRAAAGEGLASVGPGERILPAGAGSTGPISISVNGVGGRDLAKIIEAKVVDGIAEYKRRERFT